MKSHREQLKVPVTRNKQLQQLPSGPETERHTIKDTIPDSSLKKNHPKRA
jgi:hypothetical protein